MVQFQKGQAGAGNKLTIDLDDIIEYDINLLDLQLMLTKLNIPRVDRGREPRIWIRYANKHICEIGVEEIQIILNSDIHLFNSFEQDTITGIEKFISEHRTEIQKLLQ